MSIPHDYYGPYGDTVHLHSRGHNRPYVEPDYIGYDCDHQLPLVSSVGAGPRGHGILANVEKSPTAGRTVVNFTDDVTGELIATTGNIDGGYIWIDAPETNKVYEGQTSYFNVHVYKDHKDQSYMVPVPAGAHGSRMYLYPEVMKKDPQDYYSASDFYSKATFCKHGSPMWKDYPMPRPCDTVAFTAVDGNRRWLALGFIQAVEGNYAVWTAKTYIELSSPYVDKEGEWCVNGEKTGFKALPEIHGEYWYINGASTGVKAQGPQGKQGPQGEQGEPGPQGATGPTGLPGRDAKVQVGNVTTLEPSQSATVSQHYDSSTNTTTLDFGIPEGTAGRSIIIDGGIYKYEDLPDWKSTPFNYAYIVDDGDGRYDLYIRGRVEADSELGGPWTVVEDWEGKPATIKEATVEWLEEGVTESYVDLRWTSTRKANEYAFDFHMAPPDLSDIRDAIDNLENEVDYLNTKLDKETEDRKTDVENLNEKLEAEKLARETEDENLRVELEQEIKDREEKIKELESTITDLQTSITELRESFATIFPPNRKPGDLLIVDNDGNLMWVDSDELICKCWQSSRFYITEEGDLWVDDNFPTADFYVEDGRLYATVASDDLTFYTVGGHVYVDKKDLLEKGE